jgi:hypothetical protein
MNSTHSIILKSFLLLFFIALIQESPAQYRDSFSSKKKYQKISKKNKKGLFSSDRFVSVKKEKDPFRNINSSKGLVGLDKDPFSSSIKNKYKPTGVSSDSFNYRQRKRAIREKYNNEYVKNKSYKSRVKHYRLKMKYG